MTLMSDTASCSCLRIFLDDKTINLSKEKVVTRILQLYPGMAFETMTSVDFKPLVVEATNTLARELESYQKLSEPEKAEAERRFQKRCVGCLISILPLVQERQKALLAA